MERQRYFLGEWSERKGKCWFLVSEGQMFQAGLTQWFSQRAPPPMEKHLFGWTNNTNASKTKVSSLILNTFCTHSIVSNWVALQPGLSGTIELLSLFSWDNIVEVYNQEWLSIPPLPLVECFKSFLINVSSSVPNGGICNWKQYSTGRVEVAIFPFKGREWVWLLYMYVII